MMFLKDGSDPEGVERILDMKYIKLVRLTLWMISAWPYKELGDVPIIWDRPGKYFILTVNSSVLALQSYFLKLNFGKISFFELGHVYITCFMNVVSVSRAFIIFQKSYREISKDFMTKIHLFNRKDDSEYSMKIHIFIHKISHYFSIYVVVLMSMGITLFNTTPLYKNIVKGAFTSNETALEHSIYYYLPIDYTRDLRGYTGVFIFNWYLSITCSIYFCCYDLFLSIFVFHVWGNLRILIFNLENFPRPKVTKTFTYENGVKIETAMFSEEERKQVYLRLRELVNHHRTIIDFIAKMSSTFGTIIFIYYGFHQISGCILLLECSTLEPDALMRYGPLTIIMFQELIQVSLIFELLGSTTESLMNAVYSLPWECMDTGNRKIVQILMRQSQIPLSTKASGMVEVGSGTMVAILKTSLSYFVMLRTFAAED